MAAGAKPHDVRSDAQPRVDDATALTSFSMIAAAIVLDLLIVSLLTWTLARAQGVALWPADTLLSALSLAAPILAVLGAWGSLGFSLRFARSFRSHLTRTAIGAGAMLAFAFALYVGVSGAMIATAGYIAICSAVVICALHANHLGVIRSLVRAGAFSLPAPDRE